MNYDLEKILYRNLDFSTLFILYKLIFNYLCLFW